MAISKCPQEKTGGLPANITIAVNHQYDMIANISVEDGLINGAECSVKYVQLQQNNEPFPAVICIMFENSKIGKNSTKNTSIFTKDTTSTITGHESMLTKDVS